MILWAVKGLKPINIKTQVPRYSTSKVQPITVLRHDVLQLPLLEQREEGHVRVGRLGGFQVAGWNLLPVIE